MGKCLEKMLVISMRFGKSSRRGIRIIGKLLGILPVWYADYLEKKYQVKEWNDGEDKQLK